MNDVVAGQLRARFAEENIEELVDLLRLASKLHVDRDDFEPPAAPPDEATADVWQDYSDELIEFADKIDDKLVVAVADADLVRKHAIDVLKNLGL